MRCWRPRRGRRRCWSSSFVGWRVGCAGDSDVRFARLRAKPTGGLARHPQSAAAPQKSARERTVAPRPNGCVGTRPQHRLGGREQDPARHRTALRVDRISWAARAVHHSSAHSRACRAGVSHRGLSGEDGVGCAPLGTTLRPRSSAGAASTTIGRCPVRPGTECISGYWHCASRLRLFARRRPALLTSRHAPVTPSRRRKFGAPTHRSVSLGGGQNELWYRSGARRGAGVRPG